MEDCTSCHEQKGVSTECKTCHVGDKQASARTRGPMAGDPRQGLEEDARHGADRLLLQLPSGRLLREVPQSPGAAPRRVRRHARRAGDHRTQQSCETCHKSKSFCSSCHGMAMPHPAGFLKQHPTLTRGSHDPSMPALSSRYRLRQLPLEPRSPRWQQGRSRFRGSTRGRSNDGAARSIRARRQPARQRAWRSVDLSSTRMAADARRQRSDFERHLRAAAARRCHARGPAACKPRTRPSRCLRERKS